MLKDMDERKTEKTTQTQIWNMRQNKEKSDNLTNFSTFCVCKRNLRLDRMSNYLHC